MNCLLGSTGVKLTVLSIWSIYFRHTMHRDAPMATLTKNDGMISLQHCQEWSFAIFFEIIATYYLLRIQNFIEVSMWVADQMCCIHIRTVSPQLCPSFKYQQGLNSHARKTDRNEKTRLYPLTPRNQFVHWTKSTKTMYAGAEMPIRRLYQEHLNNNS